MSEWWDKQIQRADRLIPKANGSKELLKFYAQLLRAQKDVYEFLRSRKDWLPSGDIEVDLPMLNDALTGILKSC
jgi:predicted RNA-binding protein with PUA domain